MTAAAVVRRRDRWVVLRVGLAALWLVWAVLAWWTAPRPATLDEARADFAADRVVAAGWSHGLSADQFWGATTTIVYSTDGATLVYRTTDMRVHHVDVPFGPERAALARKLDTVVGGLTVTGLGPLTLVLVVFGLSVLVAGPHPVIGTKWYWFWMGGVPFGLGLLYWLAVERPWARPEPPAVDPKTGRPRRRTGLAGFAFMILSGIALSILVAVVSAVVGDFAVPTR